MYKLPEIKLSAKIPALLIGAALITTAAVGIVGYLDGSKAVQATSTSKFVALNDARSIALATYLESIKQDLKTVATNPITIDAVRSFSNSWQGIAGDPTTVLQKSYIEDNPHPLGEKENLDSAADGTFYSSVHGKYHPWFRTFLRERGYYDIFLFDLDGNLVYSVFKEADFATNLNTGPWKDTDLGNVFRAALEGKSVDSVSFFDFKPYAPSADAPASFIGSPLFDSAGTKTGVLVFQMPIDRINHVMHVESGMGETGETILVGSDRLLRSDSRFHQGDSILKVKLDTEAVARALAGETGTVETLNEEGHPALSSFRPFEFEGTTWALIAQQDLSEVNASIVALRNKMIMWGAGIVLVMMILGLLAGRGVSRPITALVTTMRTLADGNTDIEVPGHGRRDEIGTMAESVEYFRQKLIENEKLEREQAEAEKRAAAEKAETMNRLAADFEGSVGNVITVVGSAAQQMKSSATSMTMITNDTSDRSTSVAAASEEASANVQTVATATEELSSSVQEISRQISQSADMANTAVEKANTTNQRVEQLAEAAQQIGDVVDLINDIAAQTNLLALNATIEASRAGEAGKGFAVVASEVKSLATQTAKATEEIGNQIHAIQAETREAVEAISEIGKAISDISETTTAISSAVEEQGAATQEIASNVQQAAAGTQDVSTNIAEVSRGTQEAGASAAEVMTSSEQIQKQSEELQSAVSDFLQRVRAA